MAGLCRFCTALLIVGAAPAGAEGHQDPVMGLGAFSSSVGGRVLFDIVFMREGMRGRRSWCCRLAISGPVVIVFLRLYGWFGLCVFRRYLGDGLSEHR